MTREEAIKILKAIRVYECYPKSASEETGVAIEMAIEALSAAAEPQIDQYKKGFEDAKRAFLVEYARESENMRKRNAQLEVMLNAQKTISAEAKDVVRCDDCKHHHTSEMYEYCDLIAVKGRRQRVMKYCSLGERR